MYYPQLFHLIVVFFMIAPIVIAQQPVPTVTPTPTGISVPELYRWIDVSRMQVIGNGRIRTEPGVSGGNATVIRTLQIGEVFDIRPDVEPVEADGYTWIPVIVDSVDAWVAKEGILQEVKQQVKIPVTAEEIETADKELPTRAVDTVVKDNQLYAIDADGTHVAVRDWGSEVNQPLWIEISVHGDLLPISGTWLSRYEDTETICPANKGAAGYPYKIYSYAESTYSLEIEFSFDDEGNLELQSTNKGKTHNNTLTFVRAGVYEQETVVESEVASGTVSYVRRTEYRVVSPKQIRPTEYYPNCPPRSTSVWELISQ